MNAQNFIDQIQGHRSIRKFTKQDIDEEVLENILKSGVRASTSGNMQFYSVIITRNSERKKRLYEIHEKQEMILEAPVLLTFCADLRRFADWVRYSGGETDFSSIINFVRGVVDVSLVAQNCAVAAESLGLGICYMGTTLSAGDEVASFLELPSLVFPVTTLVMGHPLSKEKEKPLVPRLPQESIIHHEKYYSPSPEELLDSYRRRDGDFWQRMQKNEKFKKVIAEKELKNSAQLYAATKYKKEELDLYSQRVSALLKKQGFLQNT